MITCEYCFSHYITIGLLCLTGYKLLYDDWKGYLVAGFSLVWVANIYMSLFGKIRLGIKKEKIELAEKKMQVDEKKGSAVDPDSTSNSGTKKNPSDGNEIRN